MIKFVKRSLIFHKIETNIVLKGNKNIKQTLQTKFDNIYFDTRLLPSEYLSLIFDQNYSMLKFLKWKKKNTCLWSELRRFIIWRTSGLSGKKIRIFSAFISLLIHSIRWVCVLWTFIIKNRMGSYHHYIYPIVTSSVCWVLSMSFEMIMRIWEMRVILIVLFWVRLMWVFFFYSIWANLWRGFTETNSIHCMTKNHLSG